MDILITLLIGAIIGWIAGSIMGTEGQMGLIGNIVVGIVGSYLGFWLGPQLGVVPHDGIGRFLVALGGAVVLIILLKALRIFR
jgi:uncharacterized membrane protein YeaQ/YmgE (transglycosylase-associated protein family)